MDETYVRVKGRWCYLYRAIDSAGATIDFLLSAFRDADAAKRRDVDCYRDKFAEGSWMVIDDIYGADANEKITPSRADVDALVAEGLLQPLGFYGWSTWIGRWRGRDWS